MKKFKTICSAIVAFTVLALAGCDMEVPDSEKVEYASSIKYDAGVATSTHWDDSQLVVGISPMYGTWKITSIKGELIVVDESVKGAEAWWDNRKDSTPTTLDDGETVTMKLECTTEGTAAMCVHCHNDTGWWWYNPGDGNFWGDDSLEGTYDKTFSTSTRTVAYGNTYTFVITRNGDKLDWTFSQTKEEGAN